MVDALTAVALGVLQGVLEWLPVSSEGVLVLVLLALGEEAGAAVGLALWLHVGTLGAAVVYLRRDLWDALRGVRRPSASPERRLLAFLVLATFLTGLVGGPLLLVGLTDVALPAAHGTLLIGGLLLVTALVLWRAGPGGLRGAGEVRARDGAVPGLAQGLAALPGLSRSGLTQAALFAGGFEAETALRLSFLMSVPAVAGAQIGLALLDPVPLTVEALLAAAVAFAVGLAAIDVLLRVARRVRFERVVAALAVVALAVGAWLLVAGPPA